MASRLHQIARSGALEEGEDFFREATSSRGRKAANALDGMQRTPLHLACWAGHEGMIGLLIKHRADCMALAQDGFTPLHFCSQAGCEGGCRLLLEEGVEVDAKLHKTKKTPLHLAAAKGHAEVVRVLIQAGANISSENSKGQTPLNVATKAEVKAALVGEKSFSNDAAASRTDMTDKEASAKGAQVYTETDGRGEGLISGVAAQEMTGGVLETMAADGGSLGGGGVVPRASAKIYTHPTPVSTEEALSSPAETGAGVGPGPEKHDEKLPPVDADRDAGTSRTAEGTVVVGDSEEASINGSSTRREAGGDESNPEGMAQIVTGSGGLGEKGSQAGGGGLHVAPGERVGSLAERRRKKRKLAQAMAGKAGKGVVSLSHLDGGDGDDIA